jgi:transcription initiation factor TFIIE subunit alpha
MEKVNRLEHYQVREQKSSEKGLKSQHLLGWYGEAEASEWKFESGIPDILFGSSAHCLSGGVSKLFFVDDETLKKVAALFGEDAVRVVEVLKGAHEVVDIEIADKTQIQLKMVRKALYSLYDHSLVALRRSRDKETGWFIFNWRLQPDQVEGFILNQKRRVLEKLEIRLEYEKSHTFYTCQTQGCKRFSFEEAFELLFKCPACNKPMMHVNNDLIVRILTRKIEQITAL